MPKANSIKMEIMMNDGSTTIYVDNVTGFYHEADADDKHKRLTVKSSDITRYFNYDNVVFYICKNMKINSTMENTCFPSTRLRINCKVKNGKTDKTEYTANGVIGYQFYHDKYLVIKTEKDEMIVFNWDNVIDVL